MARSPLPQNILSVVRALYQAVLEFLIMALRLAFETPVDAKSPNTTKSHRPALLDTIERKTNRKITMETALTDEHLARCVPQSDSPLYKLPKELRDMIFVFATGPYEDPIRKYKDTAFYYRPGHTARHKTSTALLLTCRRAWLEANALPMQAAEHAFWFQRGPYDMNGDEGWRTNIGAEYLRYSRFLNKLTQLNLRNVGEIHLFMQMFHAEQAPRSLWTSHMFPYDKIMIGFRPKKFRLTIRYTDWWEWENNAPLRLDDRWVQHMLDGLPTAGIESFVLELETREAKRDQLRLIVERLMQLQGAPKRVRSSYGDGAGTKFVTRTNPEYWHWVGPTRIDDKEYFAHQGMHDLRYHVAVITWHALSLSDSELSRVDFDTTRPNPPFPQYRGPIRITGGRTPFMVMREREQREQTRSEIFGPLWQRSVMRADACEGARRELFEKQYGDFEAARYRYEWALKGSLLKFEA